MDTKLVILIAGAAALLGSAMGANVFGQASHSPGTWQMVAGSGGILGREAGFFSKIVAK